MYETMKPYLAMALRKLLTAAAASLATHGLVTAGPGTEAFIGGGMLVGSLAWSWWVTSGHVQAQGVIADLRAVLRQKADDARKAASQGNAPKALSVIALVIGVALCAAMAPGIAKAQQIKTPQDVIADIRAKLGAIPSIQSQLADIKAGMPALKSPQQVAGDIDQFVQAVDLVTEADLEDGIKIFTLAKNYSGSNCFTALRDVVKANAAANDDPATVPATDAPAPPAGSVADKAKDLPIQHAFRAIAKLYNLMVSNQPGGAVRSQCAAMKDDFNNSGPMSQLLSSGPMAKVLPIFKMLGILA